MNPPFLTPSLVMLWPDLVTAPNFFCGKSLPSASRLSANCGMVDNNPLTFSSQSAQNQRSGWNVCMTSWVVLLIWTHLNWFQVPQASLESSVLFFATATCWHFRRVSFLGPSTKSVKTTKKSPPNENSPKLNRQKRVGVTKNPKFDDIQAWATRTLMAFSFELCWHENYFSIAIPSSKVRLQKLFFHVRIFTLGHLWKLFSS